MNLPKNFKPCLIATSISLAFISAPSFADKCTDSTLTSKIVGSGSAETINGTDGNDCIDGQGGQDVIFGGKGNDSIYGNSGADTINGGEGDDYLEGGNSGDTVSYEGAESAVTVILGNNGHGSASGGAGNDTIQSMAHIIGSSHSDTLTTDEGANTVMGGSGNDTISTGAGNDELHGGADDDHLDGGKGNDIFYAGTGNDTIVGGEGKDTIYASEGNDVIDGGDDEDTLSFEGLGPVTVDLQNISQQDTNAAGLDTITNIEVILGSSFDDIISGGDIEQTIDGGDGNDIITGRDFADSLIGGAGSDSLYGGGGDDRIEAGEDNDYVEGGAGNDTVYGDLGDDVIYGGADNDLLRGEEGEDTLYGGAGNDRLVGDTGSQHFSDTLFGGEGDDTLEGEGGDDYLDGGIGADVIRGGGGNDTIIAGLGDDIDGGSGNDNIKWSSTIEGELVINTTSGEDTVTVTDSASLSEMVVTVSDGTQTNNTADSLEIQVNASNKVVLDNQYAAENRRAEFLALEQEGVTVDLDKTFGELITSADFDNYVVENEYDTNSDIVNTKTITVNGTLIQEGTKNRTLTNLSDINVTSGANIVNDHVIVNEAGGEISFESSSTISTNGTKTGELENNGLITVADDELLSISSQHISGSGTFSGSTALTGGSINAGNSPGQLTFDGDTEWTSLDLIMEVADSSPGFDWDTIFIEGDLSLNGLFDITVDYLTSDDLTSLIDQSFEFLNISGSVVIDGTTLTTDSDLDFSLSWIEELTSGWTAHWLNNDDGWQLVLGYMLSDEPGGDDPTNEVPEPSSLGLFALAGGLIGWRYRKRLVKK